ncbi:MAG TPA: hypothetical protein VHE55_05685 [Fimbriimonadaceae bacterium]|nr:hypothetical protein [Fimbriimonadaceae bacterium]
MSPNLQKALDALRSNRPAEAERLARKEVAERPSVIAFKALVDACHKQGRLVALEVELNGKRKAKNLVKGVDLGWLYAKAILMREQNGLRQDADDVFKVIKRHQGDKDGPSLLCLGACQMVVGDLLPAREFFRRAVAAMPKAYTVRMALAMSYCSGSRGGSQPDVPEELGKALQQVMIIIDSGVKYPPALSFAGGMAETRHDYVNARKYYEQALALVDPKSKTAKFLQEALARIGK